jgi:dCMP deaminase
MSRPSWNSIWLDFAETISKRSYDPQFQVGCCIVTEDNCQVLAVGYNGNHRGGPNKRESEEPGHSGFIHAEINALIKLDYNNPKKKKMYLTLSPCRACAKAIINGGISEVYYKTAYRETSGIELLQSCGVEVTKLPNN